MKPEILASLVGTLVTALATIIVALIQSRSKKSEKPSALLVPEGYKVHHPQTPRGWIRVLLIALLGGMISYLSFSWFYNPPPTPTNNHSPSAATTSSPAVNPTPHPTLLTTAILPSSSIGRLLVRVPDTCKNNSFSIKIGEIDVGIGQTNTSMEVAAGTYDIVFASDFLNQLTKRGVPIQAGQDTVVDFAEELGAIRLEGYPQVDKQLRFYANSNLGNLYLLVGEQYCASPGSQNVMLINSYTAYGYNSSQLVTDGLFENQDMSFNVEVKLGEETVIGAEIWPKQLGVLSFNPLQKGPLSFTVIDSQSGQQHNYSPYNSPGPYWMPVGSYKIIMSNPIPGLIFENVEIQAGKETPLQFPK